MSVPSTLEITQLLVVWNNGDRPAQLMRRLLVDFARARNRQKRDDALQVSLSEAAKAPSECSTNLAALDDALQALEKMDRQQARVLEPGRGVVTSRIEL